MFGWPRRAWRTGQPPQRPPPQSPLSGTASPRGTRAHGRWTPLRHDRCPDARFVSGSGPPRHYGAGPGEPSLGPESRSSQIQAHGHFIARGRGSSLGPGGLAPPKSQARALHCPGQEQITQPWQTSLLPNPSHGHFVPGAGEPSLSPGGPSLLPNPSHGHFVPRAGPSPGPGGPSLLPNPSPWALHCPGRGTITSAWRALAPKPTHGHFVPGARAWETSLQITRPGGLAPPKSKPMGTSCPGGI